MIVIVDRKIIALIPARNEADSIGYTIESIKKQTVYIDQIIVVVNNCSDNTVESTFKYGAEVMVMIKNRNMKAGAINHALERIIPRLNDDDCILIMDADTTITEDFVEKCLQCLIDKPRVGAVSSIFTGRPCKSLLGTLQTMEYWRYRRQIVRNDYRAFVLTGTASVFLVKTLKGVKAGRLNGLLPNFSKSYYDTYGRTEDNEITLAILKLGYDCHVVEAFSQTDVMENVSKLIRQRERWYNGALINLKSYGTSLPWYLRWVYWKQQIGLILSMMLLTMIVVTILISLFMHSLEMNKLWLILLSVLAVERTATVWSLGWKSRIIALTVIPEQIYSILLISVFGLSLINFLTDKKGKWHNT